MRDILNLDDTCSSTIGTLICKYLLEKQLLKKFIKIFYYNDYTSIKPSLMNDHILNEISSSSEISFKNSRSSDMYKNSKDPIRITEKTLFKRTNKNISIK